MFSLTKKLFSYFCKDKSTGIEEVEPVRSLKHSKYSYALEFVNSIALSKLNFVMKENGYTECDIWRFKFENVTYPPVRHTQAIRTNLDAIEKILRWSDLPLREMHVAFGDGSYIKILRRDEDDWEVGESILVTNIYITPKKIPINDLYFSCGDK